MSETNGPKSQQTLSSNTNSSSSFTGMKPLRPYGTTASPQEVANAAKMLKRIEDMKGNLAIYGMYFYVRFYFPNYLIEY